MKITDKIVALAFVATLTACSGGADNTAKTDENASSTETSESPTEVTDNGMGVGPVKTISLADIDDVMATKGEENFQSKCSSCHKMDARHVGPPLADITNRRKPEWIMNMILNPEGMTQNDPVAKELLAEYMAPMANQNLTEEEARTILEYFRKYDKK